MNKAPSDKAWLTIVGLGEDGLEGLSAASRHAIASAEIVMGPSRHLSLIEDAPVTKIEWPVPFSDGIALLEEKRGQCVVVLASGDPFWFGAGSTIARSFAADEWKALPGPSTFSLAAAHMGWAIETTRCVGLHAAPFERLRPDLANGIRAIVLLRDGAAVAAFAGYLTQQGFEHSEIVVLEALGGPRERATYASVDELAALTFAHPVCVAVEFKGGGAALPKASGLEDSFFETDGQITKRPMRALALSALSPKPYETLWDIGGGSGSIAIEWLLSHPTMQAVSVEAKPDRAKRIRRNADQLGVDRLSVVLGEAPASLDGLELPDAVFIGGGLSDALLNDLVKRLAPGTRLVAHSVTLESDAVLAEWSIRLGGTLTKVELSEPVALGSKRGWKSAYPVVQWAVVL